MRLRTAEDVIVPALFAFAADQFGDEFLDEAWEEFFLWDAVPDDIDPFFVFSFVPDAAEIDLSPGWPTKPVALHFLHQEVESCSDFPVSSSSRRAGATQASSSSNRPRLADRSISRTS